MDKIIESNFAGLLKELGESRKIIGEKLIGVNYDYIHRDEVLKLRKAELDSLDKLIRDVVEKVTAPPKSKKEQ